MLKLLFHGVRSPNPETAVFSADAQVRRIQKEFLAKLVARGLQGASGYAAKGKVQLRPASLDDPELLAQALDAGAFDAFIEEQLDGGEAAPLQKFADVKPFDVRDWARRKGVRLSSDEE